MKIIKIILSVTLIFQSTHCSDVKQQNENGKAAQSKTSQLNRSLSESDLTNKESMLFQKTANMLNIHFRKKESHINKVIEATRKCTCSIVVFTLFSALLVLNYQNSRIQNQYQELLDQFHDEYRSGLITGFSPCSQEGFGPSINNAPPFSLGHTAGSDHCKLKKLLFNQRDTQAKASKDRLFKIIKNQRKK